MTSSPARLHAVFLAAGFATRLYPLTRDHAKPLLEVAGVPMLTRILRQVECCDGMTGGIVVCNGRFHADFEAWRRTTPSAFTLDIVSDGAMDNESRLGAIRDLALALEHTPAPDEVDGYFVLACDNLFDFDLARHAANYDQDRIGRLIVREVPEPVPAGRYSEVILSGDRISSFREKPSDPRSNLSAIAVYLLPADLPEHVAQYLAEGAEFDAPGHFIAWLCSRVELKAARLSGRWLDIGSAKDLEAAAAEFEE